MRIEMGAGALFFALLAAAAPARAGDDFKTMAKEISKAARKAGMERVAVLSFVPADASASGDGWSISEKLTTQVVRAGQVRTVERALLNKLMDEHHLGRTGMLEQSNLKKLAKVLSVDGLITGSFVSKDSDVIVQARLIDVETGVIVMASEGRAPRDWSPSGPQANAPAPETVFNWETAQAANEAPQLFAADDGGEFKDSVAEVPCERAAEEADGLNRQILDLKARYWALQLKHGIPASGNRFDPGSEIKDPELKKEFYGRTRAWVLQGSIPDLNASEVKRFVDVGSKVFDLTSRCGI